jgi:hypothetical protein
MAAVMVHRDRGNYGNSADSIALDRHASFTFSPLLLHKPSILNAISPIDHGKSNAMLSERLIWLIASGDNCPRSRSSRDLARTLT